MLFDDNAGPQPPRIVTTRAEIQVLLKSLLHARVPLSIRFADRAQSCQSYVVSVDAETDSLWLDEMIPSIGDKWAAQGESFWVDAWMDGVHIRWQSAAAQKIMLADAPAFQVQLPTELIHHQRRGAFRATVQITTDTHLELIHAKGKPTLTGELLDISATGCKARIPGNQLKSLQPGERYDLSRMSLPEEVAFDIALEIRYCNYHEATDATHVGIRFHQPAPTAQRQIDRYVHYLQREARRQAKEDLF